MSKVVSITFDVSAETFADLEAVAVEQKIEVSAVVKSLVEHLVKEMGTDIISEGLRVAWDFGGEDLDEEEPRRMTGGHDDEGG